MNETHLEILKRSVEEWNQWRADNWNIKPDLSGTDLRGINMFKANLDDVNLASCDLRNSILINISARHADFSEANLEGAKMQGANMTLANLTRANLQKASLVGVIFRNAVLMEANLTGADCTGTRFESSNLLDAILYDIIAKGANFEGSNIQEAHIYAEQFKEANVPLESVAAVERKRRFDTQYALAFILFSLFIIAGFGIYVGVFQSETPGTTGTKLRAGFYLQLGGMFETIGNKEYAILYLEKSIRYNPNNSRPYYLLGSIYRRKKEPSKAVVYYKKFMELDPLSKESEGVQEYLYKYDKGPVKEN